MDNVTMTTKGTKLVIEVDLSKPGVLSSTGKTKLVASTRGAAKIPHPSIAGLSVALNVMIPA